MEFNTIAVSDGVTMGTEGMKASLISREVDRRLDRAGRPRPPARRPRLPRRLRQDSARRGDGARPSRRARSRPLQRHDLPGRLSRATGTQTVVNVFEAIGAYRAGKITLERAVRGRERRVPRTGRLRRPVHGQHDEHGASSSSGSRRPASTASRPRTRPRTAPPMRPASWSWTSSGATCGRRRS